MTRKILVLGATGMLGRTIYKYLKAQNAEVFGTSRIKDDEFLYFDVYKANLNDFFKKNEFDFVINCIGALSGSSKKDLVTLNSLFPKKLASIAQKNNTKLIHISTDAVFENEADEMFENSNTNSADEYGETKLKGEISSGLNIRTSILGFDPKEHKSLLEFALSNKKIKGYINQKWSGATTLQIAEFILWLTIANNFQNLSKQTNIIHFAPIKETTKFEILETFTRLVKKGKVVKSKGPKKTRLLKTRYVDEIELKKYTKTLKKALGELIKFDEKYLKTQKNP